VTDVAYLSAALELQESGRGEVRKVVVSPLFDNPQIELSIVGIDDEEACLLLNRRQIECLADFLTAWLGRLV
jgi:hypothetical protein